jgi:NDP-sugar pyrophosphorylase family protein
MILAAGLGARLRPATLSVPKPLFEVLGVPAIDWVLAGLRDAGVRACAINISYLGASLVRHVGSGKQWGLDVLWSDEPEILGTGGGLSAVRRFFDGEAAFLLHNGDVFTDWDLGALVAGHREADVAATMALVDPPDRDDARMVAVGDDGRVVGIRGEPTAGSGPRYVFSGVSVQGPAIFEHLPPAQDSCLVQAGLIPMLAAGQAVAGPVMGGRFCDIGTLDRFLALQWDLIPDAPVLLGSRGFPVPKSGGDGAWLAADARVDPGARLVGPVLLGPGVVVEAGAVVGPRALIGAGARVLAGARLADAVVFGGATAEGDVTGLVIPEPEGWVVT